jgi:hypothetical protein
MAIIATTPEEMNAALTKLLVSELHAIANGRTQAIGIQLDSEFDQTYITSIDRFHPGVPRVIGRKITIDLRNKHD